MRGDNEIWPHTYVCNSAVGRPRRYHNNMVCLKKWTWHILHLCTKDSSFYLLKDGWQILGFYNKLMSEPSWTQKPLQSVKRHLLLSSVNWWSGQRLRTILKGRFKGMTTCWFGSLDFLTHHVWYWRWNLMETCISVESGNKD